ncbi:MAG: histidinol-phosphate transaminase [Tissierellales bacterium]
MSKYYSDILKDLSPYTPGEQLNDKKYIKLNTNENPYPPSDKVITTIKEYSGGDLRLYPDPESLELRKVLASHHGVDIDNVFVSNGSDETLAFAFNAFYTGKKIAYPKVTYSFYPVYAKLYNCQVDELDMLDDYEIDKKALMEKKVGLVIANPNAPTGELLDKDYLLALLENNSNSLILIDEAYMDFSQEESMAKYIKEYKNLLVVRTFSKSYSLAGMRIGYAVGDKELIFGLNLVKNSFNSYPLDRLAQVAGIQAIKDQAYYDALNKEIISTREYTKKALEELGCKVLPSASNFLFVKFKDLASFKVYEDFKKEGILIRQFSYISDYVRITIGKKEDMEALIEVAKEILR